MYTEVEFAVYCPQCRGSAAELSWSHSRKSNFDLHRPPRAKLSLAYAGWILMRLQRQQLESLLLLGTSAKTCVNLLQAPAGDSRVTCANQSSIPSLGQWQLKQLAWPSTEVPGVACLIIGLTLAALWQQSSSGSSTGKTHS